MQTLIETTKAVFQNTINPLDVTLSVIGNYPYTTVFKLRNGTEIGRDIDSLNDDGEMVTRYYLWK